MILIVVTKYVLKQWRIAVIEIANMLEDNKYSVRDNVDRVIQLLFNRDGEVVKLMRSACCHLKSRSIHSSQN